jgi:hypothetical protein
MGRALRVVVALVLAAGVALAASLVFAQVAGTLIFRDVPPVPAVLAGGVAALVTGGVAWVMVRWVLRVVGM